MKWITFHRQNILLVVTILLITMFYLGGISIVPFHPDEATYLYMSGDLELFFTSNSLLKYSPEQSGNLRQYYRLVDPPLTRYVVGIGRVVRGLPPPGVDWDWSLSWNENANMGALPEKDLLTSGRLAVALLFPMTLWGIYKIGVASGSWSLGWIAMFLMAANSLVLLHTRRAMAEGILLWGLIFTIVAILSLKKRPWLASVPVALAVNAKFTAAPILILALIFILFYPLTRGERITKRIVNVVLFLIIFFGITILLNPVFWSDPINSFQAAVEHRSKLMAAQVTLFRELNPAQAPIGLWDRLLASMAQAFISPLAFADVGNYLAYTAEAERNYMAMPIHSFLRGLFAGGFMLIITLTGMLYWALQIIKSISDYEYMRARLIILIGFFLQGTAMLLVVPLSFQRYQIALIPFIVIFSGFCLMTIYSMVISLLRQHGK